jgi:hypothetical protein
MGSEKFWKKYRLTPHNFLYSIPNIRFYTFEYNVFGSILTLFIASITQEFKVLRGLVYLRIQRIRKWIIEYNVFGIL